MNIKELQEELVEKIFLIPNPVEGDDISNLERALEIINKLGRDHINDIITTNYGEFTALDYVIIADSQGSNPKISERPRIGNRVLKELEDAIRNIEGKTSEKLGLVQNVPHSRGEFLSASERALQILEEVQRNSNDRMVRETIRNLAHFALVAGSSYLVYTSNDNDEEFSMSRYLTGIFGIGVFTMLQVSQVMNCLRELTRGQQERQPFMNLENATVQPNIEERSLS